MSALDRNLAQPEWDDYPYAEKAMREVTLIADACLDYMNDKMAEIDIRPDHILSMTDMVLNQANYLAAMDAERYGGGEVTECMTMTVIVAVIASLTYLTRLFPDSVMFPYGLLGFIGVVTLSGVYTLYKALNEK